MSVTEISNTVEYAGLMEKHRNLFRFPDGSRFAVESKPVPIHRKGWRKWLAHWMGMETSTTLSMVSVPEIDFDDLDVTRTGQPAAYCILAPGLAACWPTADRDYVVSVYVGAP